MTQRRPSWGQRRFLPRGLVSDDGPLSRPGRARGPLRPPAAGRVPVAGRVRHRRSTSPNPTGRLRRSSVILPNGVVEAIGRIRSGGGSLQPTTAPEAVTTRRPPLRRHPPTGAAPPTPATARLVGLGRSPGRPRLRSCPSPASSPTTASWAVSRAFVAPGFRWPRLSGSLLGRVRSTRSSPTIRSCRRTTCARPSSSRRLPSASGRFRCAPRREVPPRRVHQHAAGAVACPEDPDGSAALHRGGSFRSTPCSANKRWISRSRSSAMPGVWTISGPPHGGSGSERRTSGVVTSSQDPGQSNGIGLNCRVTVRPLLPHRR